MTRVSCLATLAALALALAGCGSSGEAASNSGASAKTGTGGAKGRLTAPEYRLALKAAKNQNRLDRLHDPHLQAVRLGGVCGIFEKGPTELLQATRATCLSATAFLKALLAFADDARRCRSEYVERNVACLDEDMKAIAHTGRVAVANARTTNRAAARRELHGLCRKYFATSRKDIRTLARVTKLAAAFNRAVENVDPAGMKRSASRLGALLQRQKDSHADALKQARACR
jgi:hypothetical protein